MKVQMSLISALIISLIIFSYISVRQNAGTHSQANRDPLQVVQLYCELAHKGDYDGIKDLTTYYPKEYYDAWTKEVELFRQAYGFPKREIPVAENTNDRIRLVQAPKYQDSVSLKIVSDSTPRQLNEDGAFISETKSVWTNGNEARVEVVLRSGKFDKYKAEKEFLLYKTEGEWRIFSVDMSSIFKVYGMPPQ